MSWAFHCYEKKPERNNLREEGLISRWSGSREKILMRAGQKILMVGHAHNPAQQIKASLGYIDSLRSAWST